MRAFRLLSAIALAFCIFGAAVPLAAAAEPPGSGNLLRQVQEGDPLRPVHQAYDLLLDRFVYPLDPARLLAAAWQGVGDEVRSRQGWMPDGAPAFGGDRVADWELFAAHYAEVAAANAGIVPPETLRWAAIRAMAAAAEEGHTSFLRPQEYQDYLAWSRGDVKYGGIGARLNGREPTIVEIFEGSPAAQAGLRAGDAIVAVNGQPVLDRSVDEVVSQIRGPEGTVVQITVRRPGTDAPLTFQIVRATIRVPLVQSRMLDDAVGYIMLRSFPEPSVVEQVDRAHAELVAAGARALVLDLRGNSGGRLDVGVDMLSRLVADGPLFEEIDRSGRRRTSAPNGRLWEPQVPVVVLVDGGTASMGEIFAAAVQERQVGTIVGSRTAGNVAAAQVFPLEDGSALQVTVLEIRSGLDERLNEVGVEPDVFVPITPDDAAAGRDPQLEAAVVLLRQQLEAPLGLRPLSHRTGLAA